MDKPEPTKAERLAAEAVQSARSALDSETGRKVTEAAATAFDKAEAATREALASEPVRKATETGRQWLATDLGRNVAAGAAIGAAIALPVPFIGPLSGAIIGGAIGFARVVTKKS